MSAQKLVWTWDGAEGHWRAYCGDDYDTMVTATAGGFELSTGCMSLSCDALGSLDGKQTAELCVTNWHAFLNMVNKSVSKRMRGRP